MWGAHIRVAHARADGSPHSPEDIRRHADFKCDEGLGARERTIVDRAQLDRLLIEWAVNSESCGLKKKPVCWRAKYIVRRIVGP